MAASSRFSWTGLVVQLFSVQSYWSVHEMSRAMEKQFLWDLDDTHVATYQVLCCCLSQSLCFQMLQVQRQCCDCLLRKASKLICYLPCLQVACPTVRVRVSIHCQQCAFERDSKSLTITNAHTMKLSSQACQILLFCIEQTHLSVYISAQQLCTNFGIAACANKVLKSCTSMCLQEQFNRQTVLAQPELLKHSLDGPTSKTLSTSLSASSTSPKQQQNDASAELPNDIV